MKTPKTPPRSTPARVQLTPREFAALQGVCAIAALELQAIRQRTTQAIAAAERPPQQLLARLATKYPSLRPDGQYRLDAATRTIVAQETSP